MGFFKSLTDSFFVSRLEKKYQDVFPKLYYNFDTFGKGHGSLHELIPTSGYLMTEVVLASIMKIPNKRLINVFSFYSYSAMLISYYEKYRSKKELKDFTVDSFHSAYLDKIMLYAVEHNKTINQKDISLYKELMESFLATYKSMNEPDFLASLNKEGLRKDWEGNYYLYAGKVLSSRMNRELIDYYNFPNANTYLLVEALSPLYEAYEGAAEMRIDLEQGRHPLS